MDRLFTTDPSLPGYLHFSYTLTARFILSQSSDTYVYCHAHLINEHNLQLVAWARAITPESFHALDAAHKLGIGLALTITVYDEGYPPMQPFSHMASILRNNLPYKCKTAALHYIVLSKNPAFNYLVLRAVTALERTIVTCRPYDRFLVVNFASHVYWLQSPEARCFAIMSLVHCNAALICDKNMAFIATCINRFIQFDAERAMVPPLWFDPASATRSLIESISAKCEQRVSHLFAGTSPAGYLDFMAYFISCIPVSFLYKPSFYSTLFRNLYNLHINDIVFQHPHPPLTMCRRMVTDDTMRALVHACIYPLIITPAFSRHRRKNPQEKDIVTPFDLLCYMFLN